MLPTNPGIPSGLHNQQGHDRQKQFADKGAAMPNGEMRTDNRARDLANRHQEAKKEQDMAAIPEPHQGREIAGDIDNLGSR